MDVLVASSDGSTCAMTCVTKADTWIDARSSWLRSGLREERGAGRRASTAGRAPQARDQEASATGAIRRDPKNAVRVEMGQIA